MSVAPSVFIPALPEIPAYEYYTIPPDAQERVLNEEQFVTLFRRTIEQWLSSDRPQQHIVLDGLAGAGKSRLLSMLADLSHQHGSEFQRVSVETDRFIGTARDSEERRRMTDSAELFWAAYFDRQKVREILRNIWGIGDGEGSLLEPHVYNKGSGTMDDVYRQPLERGKKLVILEGADALSVYDEAFHAQSGRPKPLRAIVYAPAPLSMVSAVIRDTKRGIPVTQRLPMRIREYPYLTERIGKTLNRPDVHILDKSDGRGSLAERMAEMHQIHELQIKNAQINEKVDIERAMA